LSGKDSSFLFTHILRALELMRIVVDTEGCTDRDREMLVQCQRDAKLLTNCERYIYIYTYIHHIECMS
jgi:hypothetical protein